MYMMDHTPTYPTARRVKLRLCDARGSLGPFQFHMIFVRN